MCERCFEVAQKQNWKTKRPRTEIARSPYVVFCANAKTKDMRGLSTSLAGVQKGEWKTNTGELETEGGAKDDADESEPAHGEADIVRQLEERRLDAGHPDRRDGARHNRVGEEPERDHSARSGRALAVSLHIWASPEPAGTRARARYPRKSHANAPSASATVR